MHQIQSVSFDGLATTLNLANASTDLFKAQVAARIGRGPHEILLKRQGERPFKDQLTLEDYGVSNGVQLDLSVAPSNHHAHDNTNNTSENWTPATEISHALFTKPFLGNECCCIRNASSRGGASITLIPTSLLI